MANLRLHQLNDVKLVGRLTRDPELRFTPKGQPVCRFRLAVGRRYRDKATSEWREETAFVPVVAWREAAERCGERLKKGSPVYVEGRLKSRDWETREGQKRSDLEVEAWRVQFLASATSDWGSPPEELAAAPSPEGVPEAAPVAAGSSPADTSRGFPETGGEAVDMEDEGVPF